MQVSTRSHDYIVDTLALRHHMHLLQEPFTNPNILKVTFVCIREKYELFFYIYNKELSCNF